MVRVVLVMFTVPLMLVCRGQLAFVLVMRTASRLIGVFLIVFLVDVLGAAPGCLHSQSGFHPRARIRVTCI
jgi:hypothetical protein